MAYRFNGSSDYIEFAIAPFNGYTFGAYTVAILLKRNATGTGEILSFASSDLFTYRNTTLFSTNVVNTSTAAHTWTGPTLSSTTIWYILVATHAAGTGVPRYHYWDGSAWTHADGTGAAWVNETVTGTDRIRVAQTFNALSADIVCVGAKKSDSSDSTVATLTTLGFAPWKAYGFDWLIGFDTSLKVGGVLHDQASAGTGDQNGISGTSVVSDPPGWAWTSAATWNGSSSVSLTDTVTTAGARLGAVVHGASVATMTATVTTGSRAVTLQGSTAVSEVVRVTTAGAERMPLVPITPGSFVLVPRPPGSLVLTPR